MNGLIRHYLPKGIDLSAFSQDDLDAIACRPNSRPRKIRDFQTPYEVYHQLVETADNNVNNVALRSPSDGKGPIYHGDEAAPDWYWKCYDSDVPRRSDGYFAAEPRLIGRQDRMAPQEGKLHEDPDRIGVRRIVHGRGHIGYASAGGAAAAARGRDLPRTGRRDLSADAGGRGFRPGQGRLRARSVSEPQWPLRVERPARMAPPAWRI